MNELLMLILALLGLVGLLSLAFLAMQRGIGFKAQLSPRTGLVLEVPEPSREGARQAITEASERKGRTNDLTVALQRISELEGLPLRRVLWVDDYPDNNIYESVAIQQLGLSVTSTTSTGAALEWLDQMDFDLVISDMGRGEDPEAGIELLNHLRRLSVDSPVLIYTSRADDERARAARQLGAIVLVSPGELLWHVLEHTSADRS